MFKIATLVFCLIFSMSLGAQDFEYADTTSTKKSTIYTLDGGQFVGKVIKNNDKEVVIETLNIGKVTIPKYQISEIIEGGAITSAQFVIISLFELSRLCKVTMIARDTATNCNQVHVANSHLLG